MENISTLIGMTLVLVLIPGPNVALIVANSIKYGTRFGLMTVLGTTVGGGNVANKVCGSFMVFAGLGLALTNDDSTN